MCDDDQGCRREIYQELKSKGAVPYYRSQRSAVSVSTLRSSFEILHDLGLDNYHIVAYFQRYHVFMSDRSFSTPSGDALTPAIFNCSNCEWKNGEQVLRMGDGIY